MTVAEALARAVKILRRLAKSGDAEAGLVMDARDLLAELDKERDQ